MAKGGRATPRARQDGEPAVFSGGAVGGVQDRGSGTVSGANADLDTDPDTGPLVLQSCARGDGVARKQLRRARKDGWTPHRRAQFLQVLAATCNVREAARATGLHFSSAYDLRQRDSDFAAAWAEAIERAYSELEMRMLRDCLYGAARVEVIREGHGPTARVKSTKTVTAVPHAIALRLLQAHRAQAEAFRSKAQAGVRVTRPDDPDVVARMKAEMDAMVARYDAGRAMLAGQAGLAGQTELAGQAGG